MDALEAIHTRRSIRTYVDQPVSEERVHHNRWSQKGG